MTQKFLTKNEKRWPKNRQNGGQKGVQKCGKKR